MAGPYKILVVDDEPDLCKAIAQAFKIKGHTPFTAFNGEAAFQIVQTESIDVVVSDIRMPGWSGVELLKQVKKLNMPCLLVAMMSGFSDYSEKELYDVGADLFFQKPFSVVAFIKAVEQKMQSTLK